jgi:hypothetical protein
MDHPDLLIPKERKINKKYNTNHYIVGKIGNIEFISFQTNSRFGGATWQAGKTKQANG